MADKPTGNRNPALMLVLTLSAALCLSGCGLLPKEEEELAPPLTSAPAVSYETVAATKGNIVKGVKVTAYYAPEVQYDLSFQTRSGYLESMPFHLGDQVKKGDVVAQLDTDDVSSKIEQQKLAVRKAQIYYQMAVNQYPVGSPEIELKQIDLDSANSSLQALQTELEKCTLRAPVSGVVTYVSTTSLGEMVYAQNTLLRLADPAHLRLEYTGDQWSQFEMGRQVQATLNGQTYSGHVTMTPANMPQDASKQTANMVVFALDGNVSGIGIGTAVDIQYVQEEKKDVIVVPQNLLINYGGQNYVNVLENGVKTERSVETGISDATQVEIVHGIEEGDQLIVK